MQQIDAKNDEKNTKTLIWCDIINEDECVLYFLNNNTCIMRKNKQINSCILISPVWDNQLKCYAVTWVNSGWYIACFMRISVLEFVVPAPNHCSRSSLMNQQFRQIRWRKCVVFGAKVGKWRVGKAKGVKGEFVISIRAAFDDSVQSVAITFSFVSPILHFPFACSVHYVIHFFFSAAFSLFPSVGFVQKNVQNAL